VPRLPVPRRTAVSARPHGEIIPLRSRSLIRAASAAGSVARHRGCRGDRYTAANADACRLLVCAGSLRLEDKPLAGRVVVLRLDIVLLVVLIAQAVRDVSAGGAEAAGCAARRLDAAVGTAKGREDFVGHLHRLLAEQPVQRLPQRAHVLRRRLLLTPACHARVSRGQHERLTVQWHRQPRCTSCIVRRDKRLVFRLPRRTASGTRQQVARPEPRTTPCRPRANMMQRSRAGG